MFFTQEDYRKIEKWLLSNSIKDTEFVEASAPLQGNETLAFVQKGKNVKVSLKDLIDQIFLLGVSDFLNISDKYKENYISLNQAITLVPNKSRKIGQVITFLNQEGVWKIYQFQGTKVNQWNNTTLWIDLIQQIQGLDIIDSEDIIPKISATNQTSLLLADKSYNPDDFSGLGRVYLRKNMQKVINPNTGMYYTTNLLTQAMVSKENTIYIIQYDYSLNYQTITIPNNSVLVFNGESIDNGTLNCNSTIIVGKFIGNSSLIGTYTYQDAQADEEDITQNQLSVLKFKDKEYDEANFSGLGRTYLRKNIVNGVNILSQDMINNSNTIYHIQYDYNLNGQTITIPEGCVLLFEGGSIDNGSINFTDTTLAGDPNITTSISGTLKNSTLKPEWFGAKGDGITNDTAAIQLLINLNSNKLSLSPNKVYFVSNLSITKSIKIEGNNSILLFNNDCYATINYHSNISSNVSNIEWISSTPRISKIYINNASDYKKGDIIKIYSDDIIEGTEFKQSQYFIVGNIYSNYIEVAGKPVFNFTTNIKIQLIDNSKKIEVYNLTLSSLEHTYYNDRGLFTIIGGAYHNIKNCCIKNTNSHGFLFAGSYGYSVENLELDYQEFINTVPQSIGMGICDSASSNFTISFKGGYTQAFTCVYFTEDEYPETYGVSQFGNIKNSVATGSALDNHTNCYNLVYSDSIISSSENGIVVRGSKCIYDNISVNAAIYGLYAYGDAHNTGNSIDFLVRNTNIYSHTRCVQIENNKDYKIKGTIENCVLEGRTAAVHLKNADIVFRNCTITGLITISNNVNVIFDNCTLNGYINIAEGITDSNVTISNSICNFTNHSYFRECPTTIENCTVNIKGQYYIIATLATNLVFNRVTFNTPYQYLLRAQDSTRVELNSCVINHTGSNIEFHVFRTVGITTDAVLQAVFNDVYIYNKSSQDTKVYLSYIDSWEGGSSINNIVRAVYVDNNKLSELNICNRTDRIMVINDILDNPEYAERGKINVDGTLKSKEVIVYRIEDIVPGLTDTIYKIVKDIDLGGISKGIPANCTLDFQGGSFSNGTITFNNTELSNNIKLTDIDIKGTSKDMTINLNWFTSLDANIISNIINRGFDLYIPKGIFSFDTILRIERSGTKVKGEDKLTSIIEFPSSRGIVFNNFIIYRDVEFDNFTIRSKDTAIDFTNNLVAESYPKLFYQSRFTNLWVLSKENSAIKCVNNKSSQYSTMCFDILFKDVQVAGTNGFEGLGAKTLVFDNIGDVSTSWKSGGCDNAIMYNSWGNIKNVNASYGEHCLHFMELPNDNVLTLDTTIHFQDCNFENLQGVFIKSVRSKAGITFIFDNVKCQYTAAGTVDFFLIDISFINNLYINNLLFYIGSQATISEPYTDYIHIQNRNNINYNIDSNLKYRYGTSNSIGLLESNSKISQNISKGTSVQRPVLTSDNEGFQYFDTSLSKYICWNGTAWTNLDGTALA